MNDKRIAAVICEYNPFHRGHEYQLNEIKKSFGGVICVMSGDLVQRGDTAIAGKYERAKAALMCGADLVLELPAPWCCSSAADFARAGVVIAAGAGADALAFGVESDAMLILEVASLCKDESFSARVAELSSSGGNVSYPAAFCTAVGEKLGAAAGEAMRKPNNILAVEYIKNLPGTVAPFPVPRAPGYLSSSEIRERGRDGFASLLPEGSAAVYEEVLKNGGLRDISRLDSFFAGYFRTLKDPEQLKGVYGMTPDLAAKLFRAGKERSAFADICASCTDKKYTSARVRRAVIAAALGFKTENVKADPAFTAVLAANATGREILAAVRKNTALKIITKPAHALSADKTVRAQFTIGKTASDIAALASEKPGSAAVGETPFVLI
ncbi:MAG: nucleotidyltransferase family protein [Clostridia bacterium]|nr:nucleotidyltransferase family protein [Clostridia bacterium]